MTSLETYSLFITKANRGDSNQGVSILQSRFVQLYNVERLVWLLNKIEEDNSNNQIDTVQELLVIDEELKKPVFALDKVKYDLSDLFARFEASYSLVHTDCCKNIKIFNYELKSGNLSPVRQDDIHQPSFDYQEAPSLVTNNKLIIYKGNDYKIDKTFLSYYKFPIAIDISGYEHEDGTPSIDINPGISDDNINQIIDRVVKEVQGESENPTGYQIASEKVKK